MLLLCKYYALSFSMEIEKNLNNANIHRIVFIY